MIKIEKVRVSGMEAAIRGMRNAKNSWDKADSVSGLEAYHIFCDKCNAMAETAVELQKAQAVEEDQLSLFEEQSWQEKIDEEYMKYLNNGLLYLDEESGLCDYFLLGPKDAKLAHTLSAAGTDHGKFLRQISVTMDITAPLFFWKEFDTYKVGTTANSTSTMHTITNSPITMENFSFDLKFSADEATDVMCDMITIVALCEKYRKAYLEWKERDPRKAAQYWRMLIEILPNGWLQTRTISMNYAVAKNMYKARRNHKLKEWHEVCKAIAHLPYAKELIL